VNYISQCTVFVPPASWIVSNSTEPFLRS